MLVLYGKVPDEGVVNTGISPEKAFRACRGRSVESTPMGVHAELFLCRVGVGGMRLQLWGNRGLAPKYNRIN